MINGVIPPSINATSAFIGVQQSTDIGQRKHKGQVNSQPAGVYLYGGTAYTTLPAIMVSTDSSEPICSTGTVM